MSSDVVVLPWMSSFAEFPHGRDASVEIGPRDWSIAFVHIPVRPLGPSQQAAETLRLTRAAAVVRPALPLESDYLVLPLLSPAERL